MKRGRPFEPGNKFGRGRPLGSRNKKSLCVQQLIDEHSESVARKALVKALEGDSTMLQTLLSYILPRRKDAPLKTGMLRTGTAKEISESLEAILQQVFAGKLTPGEAQALAALLDSRRETLQTEEFEARLRLLEKISN
jgi:hypothetical protein